MPVAFNPFNPAHYFGFFGSAPIAREPRPAVGAPIRIEARASDPGIQVTAGKDRLTLRGTTQGGEPALDVFGGNVGEYARSVSFTLDIDAAPTEDVFGNTSYREKNSRSFQVHTSPGATAEQVAEALAAKVNRHMRFGAKVTTADDGSATIRFSRR